LDLSKVPKEEYEEITYAPEESDDSDDSVEEFFRTKPRQSGKR
jgi:hypothetical protein